MTDPRDIPHPLTVIRDVLALVGFVWLVVWGTDCSAKAQDSTVSAAEFVHAAVAEADWSASDRAAIWHVLKRRADRAGVSMEAMLRRYVSAFRVRPSARIRWVMELEPTCSQPAHWPSNQAWPHYQPKCLQAFSDAQAFASGVLTDPCPGATHFGGMRLAADHARAATAVAAGRWRVVRCAKPTVNTFFAEVGTGIATRARGTKQSAGRGGR